VSISNRTVPLDMTCICITVDAPARSIRSTSEWSPEASSSCSIATPIFFPPELWLDAPSDWHTNIVSGKSYDVTSGEGLRIWKGCMERAANLSLTPTACFNLGIMEERPRYGQTVTIRPRLGQGSFRYVLQSVYKKCAVTREQSLPALDAAHIVPYAHGGVHEVPNRLLLRADIHRLYDRGFVTVTPDFRFKVRSAS